jgi:Flp pilus assembly protein TadG
MALCKIRRGLRQLLPNTEGAAMLEMAFVAPVMIMLYLMAYILSDAVACNRKVTVATRELTDVTSRYMSLQQSDLTNIIAAAQQVLAPYKSDTAHATIRISEVQVATATQATVVWSCTNAPTNSIVTGTGVVVPTGLISTPMLPNASSTPAVAGAYLLMGEISYNYTPVFSFAGAGAMTFQDRIFLVPRSATNIPLSGACPSQSSGN